MRKAAAMRGLAWTMSDPRRWTWTLRAGRAGRLLGGRYGRIRNLPGPLAAWTSSRYLPRPPRQTFRDWWRAERPQAEGEREHPEQPRAEDEREQAERPQAEGGRDDRA